MRANNGFSLMEIMIALAIIGIVSSYAIPHYQDYLRRNHRAEASMALENLALNLDHYYNLNQSYNGASLEKLNIPARTHSGLYQLAIQKATDDSFVVTASPLGAQTMDAQCGELRLDSVGNESATGTSPNPEQDCW